MTASTGAAVTKHITHQHPLETSFTTQQWYRPWTKETSRVPIISQNTRTRTLPNETIPGTAPTRNIRNVCTLIFNPNVLYIYGDKSFPDRHKTYHIKIALPTHYRTIVVNCLQVKLAADVFMLKKTQNTHQPTSTLPKQSYYISKKCLCTPSQKTHY